MICVDSRVHIPRREVLVESPGLLEHSTEIRYFTDVPHGYILIEIAIRIGIKHAIHIRNFGNIPSIQWLVESTVKHSIHACSAAYIPGIEWLVEGRSKNEERVKIGYF